MNDFVTKPINPEKLISVLCHWITKSRMNIRSEQHRKQCGLSEPADFDFTDILTMLGNNEELLTQLLCSFRDDIEPTRVNIQDQINQNNLLAAEVTVHTLKGTAGNLGLTGLYAAADELDTNLKQGKLCQNAYNNFLRVLRETEEALTRLLQD